jgi:hypothetical protein
MNPKTAQHTPTPWEPHEDWNKTVEIFGGDPPDKFKNVTDNLSWEDAAFIVRAVNAHEELLDACKYVLHRLESGKEIVAGKLIHAIAKAEAQS